MIKKPTATSAIEVHYIHTDHLNTPRVIVNSSNTTIWRWDSVHAFGANIPFEDPDNNGQLFEYNPRFPGQYFDKETNLHYNYFRYYEPETGRYISPDPIGLAGGLNIYGYVEQNPLSFIDPLGLYWGEEHIDYAGSAIGGSGDFIRNYRDMRNANNISSDKYFHCKANCEATQRGKGGKDAARCISNAREWFDQNIKGDPASESAADQIANRYGRAQSIASPGDDCRQVCTPYRPNGLPSQY